MENVSKSQNILGDRLKAIRKGLRFSQAMLAIKSGYDQREISYWETGEREPSASQLADLAIALEVSTDWLLGLSEEKIRH
jgi:transcriptional regulator with XRE-family HTH domain